MKQEIGFIFVDATPGIRVLFSEGKGRMSKKAVSVIVFFEGTKAVLGSTGFDTPACSLFSMIYDLGTGFSGNLYKGGITVGDFFIRKGLLTVRIGGNTNTVGLDESDIADLKAIFKKIGEAL